MIEERSAAVILPSQDVQREAGRLMAEFPQRGVRNVADPFVIAEALLRGFTVTTYEGRSFSGVPTVRWGGPCQASASTST